MPAIQPARLKIQASELAQKVQNPAGFVRNLHDLLDFYADRTYRPGQVGTPRPLTRAYHAPTPVLRQVLQELIPFTAAAPQEIRSLCAALWSEPVLEFRLLAANLLGHLPTDPAEPILNLLSAWVETNPEETVLAALCELSTPRLRQEQPGALLKLAAHWLTSQNIPYQWAGLHVIAALAADPQFANLPALYPLLSPFVRLAPSALRPDLLNALQALARRSAPETAHFLRENLFTPGNPDTPWVIRQILPEFPPAVQVSLRAAIASRV